MTDKKTQHGDDEQPLVYLGYIEDGDVIDHENKLISRELHPQEGGSKIENSLDNSTDVPWLLNKLGGLPIFPFIDEDGLANLESTLESIVCKQCKKPCMLVFQINGIIDDSKLNRVIQVYACIESKCSKHTWTVLRCLFPDSANRTLKSKPKFLHVVESKTFGTLLVDQTRRYFRPYYISVMEEPTGRENFAANNIEALKLASQFSDLDLKPAPIEEKFKNLKNYQAPKQPAHLSDLDDFERFQLENLYANDKATYRFYKKLRLFQGQIVRYDWKGEPLLSSQKFKYQPSTCLQCQTRRCFEFQLVPALLNYLSPIEDASSKDFDRELIDFSTVLVSCCPMNCAEKSSYHFEEATFVPDPDSRLYNRAKHRMASANGNGKLEVSEDQAESSGQNLDCASTSQPTKSSKKRNKRKRK